jgi:hypothetical protein
MGKFYLNTSLPRLVSHHFNNIFPLICMSVNLGFLLQRVTEGGEDNTL